MTAADLRDLLDRVQSWPKSAQDELMSIANQIESELQTNDYVATRDELRIIDAAMASIDAGDGATQHEGEAALAKFHRK